MLSIAKLRVGAEAYQLTGVAQSLGAYYSGAGEAPGWWAGAGAEQLGLSGEVAGDDLRAVLAGLDPHSGGLTPDGKTVKVNARRVPGFDLTFKAPKSVSTLYAVTDDPRVQGAIIESCEEALRDTLGWLEREVMAVRRGTGNQKFLADLAARDPEAAEQAKQRVEPGAEMIAAVFRHRTSRAGDPLLHWHTLIPNMVKAADGRWSAFIHPDVYKASRAAGEVFQAAVRERLSASLGVEWRPGRHVHEVAGVPQGLADRFSKRSAEIEAFLQTTGIANDPSGRQDAVLATRKGKAEQEGERFDAAWKEEAIEFGWGPDQAEELLAGLTPTTARDFRELWRLPEEAVDEHGVTFRHDRIVTPEEWIGDLLRRELTWRDATFSERDLTQAVAYRLGSGATVATVERVAARVLGSEQVLPVQSDRGLRYTSTELAEIEGRLLETFARRDERTPVKPAAIDAAIAGRSTIGADQANAVRVLAGSTDPVSVLVGPAGTGKTFVFAAVRDAFERDGYRVIGAAPSAKAALELQGAGLDASTMHSLYGRWMAHLDWPDERTVIVVDEAGMASTRDLENLVSHAVAAGARVILSGDHHQLPEINAGGALAAAAGADLDDGTPTRVRAVAELTVNRRQKGDDQGWERDALTHLRNGSVPAAVGSYRDHGRVVVTDDGADMVATAVGKWFEARDQGLSAVLMAGTNLGVKRLNDAVRAELVNRGELAGDVAVHVGGYGIGIGDRVVLRENWWQDNGKHRRADRLVNGQTATVTGVDRGRLIVRRDGHDDLLTLSPDYLRRNSVELGYAVTTHRAQGGTWKIGIGVGLDGLFREASYVLMSRAERENWLVITGREMDQVDDELARHDAAGIPLPSEAPTPLDEDLHDRLARSRAKTMAIVADPHARQVDEIARTNTVRGLDVRLGYIRFVERQARQEIGIDPNVLAAASQRAENTARHIACGQRVKVWDRQNIGTVVGIHDEFATVDVHFVAAEGRATTRELDWTMIEIVDHNVPKRTLPPAARIWLDKLVDDVATTMSTYEGYLRQRNVGLTEGMLSERARDLIIDRWAARLTAARPGWLDELVGARPVNVRGAEVWDHAVREIAAYRCHARATDVDGLGPVPADADLARRWHHASRQVLEARTWLGADQTRAVDPWPRRRTFDELRTRHGELKEILASAPADQRDLIGRLTDDLQPALPLETITAELQTALDTQGTRREWILTHWPHVVEHTHVKTALDTHDWAPDLPALTHQLATGVPTGDLRDAATGGEPWLDRALCRLVPNDQDGLDTTTVRLLDQLARYRARWNIDTIDPLGDPPTDPRQARDYNTLLNTLRDSGHGQDLPEHVQVAMTRIEHAAHQLRDRRDSDSGLGLE